MARLSIFLLVIGAVFGYLGYEEHTVMQLGKPEPQKMTLAKLASSGPGDNIHLTVSNFLSGENIVINEKSGRWTKAWVPLFAEDAQATDKVSVLMVTSKASNQEELNGILDRSELTGVVTNSIDSISGEQLKLLKESYPSFDSDSVHIFECERSFPTSEKAYGMIIGGLITAAIGGVIGLKVLKG